MFVPMRCSAAAPNPPPGQLREDADVRDGVELARHHDEIVASVGGLEVVVPTVLRRVGDRGAKAAAPVVEEDADGVRSPPDPGDVEGRVAVQPADPDLVAVGGRRRDRGAERAVGQLREDLHADPVERATTTSARQSPVMSDRDRRSRRRRPPPPARSRRGWPHTPRTAPERGEAVRRWSRRARAAHGGGAV